MFHGLDDVCEEILLPAHGYVGAALSRRAAEAKSRLEAAIVKEDINEIRVAQAMVARAHDASKEAAKLSKKTNALV
jgi:hypothetical protein